MVNSQSTALCYHGELSSLCLYIVNSHPFALSHGELSPHRSFSHGELSPHRSFSHGELSPWLFLMVNSQPIALLLFILLFCLSFVSIIIFFRHTIHGKI